MAQQRGLVVSPPITIGGGQLHLVNADLDPQDLRTSLLFWDKLNFPKNNLIGFDLSPDAEYLASAGILSRKMVSVRGAGSFEDGFLAAHLTAFRTLDREEPGVWSLATGERSISFPDSDLSVGRGVLVRLHQAIPVPDKEVPLNDVLEFRERRRDELRALRQHLEQVYQRVVNAGDGELALATEIEALERAIADHIKVSRERKFSLRLTDLSASLNVERGVAAGAVAFSAGQTLLQSLMAGGVASLSAKVGAALKGRAVNKTPYKYVSSYNRELFP